MRTLPFSSWYYTLAIVGRSVDRDCERTEYAQRKSGQGIRTEHKRGQLHVVRTDSKGHGLPVTKFQQQRYSL